MSSDPFTRHGIDHLSPSSLRLFRDNQAVWIGRYLLHVPDEAGPKAWRGTAVEAGLDQVLFLGADHAAAMVMVKRAWDARAQGLVDDEVVKEYDQLGAFLTQAIDATKGRPIPLTRQGKISIRLPGISIPLTGFTDYRWPTYGIDLKTTHRIPSAADPDHVAQMSAYMMDTGLPFSLVYCSTKRWSIFDVTPQMATEGYDRLLDAAHALRSFLDHAADARDALSMCAPDYTNFYFSDVMREAVRAAKRPVEVLP
jgi:hypothetical protein